VVLIKTGIGIDTGGTYTDAVIYDFESKKILATSKALTTKEDLSVGILEALDALPAESVQSAGLISLSTTLATNACVEDRGGSAKLIFLGGDYKIIDRYGGEYGLPPSGEMYIQESYAKFSGLIEREPDWELFCGSVKKEFEGLDGAGIIETNAIKNSAVVEKKAAELFSRVFDNKIPVVCGHELFSELNCLRRGASTLLNARLFSVIRVFMDAIKTAMEKRGINAPVVIVRSDGSLMSEQFAHTRPVETLLCGPAASVMGSSSLAKAQNSIVVDMGGTTTDIALINNGVPYMASGGISVGKWRTFVDGLYIKTFGLGGDTAIHYNDKNLFLEDYRVVPLCVAAQKYPRIITNLRNLLAGKKKHTKYLHEHYITLKDIQNNPRYTTEEKQFCENLREGPLSLLEAAEKIPGRDVYTLNVSRLIKEGAVQLCGLTPTDVMHIKGDFDKFSAENSLLGIKYAAFNLDTTAENFCDMVYDEIKRRLYVNIVLSLLEKRDEHYMKNKPGKEVERFVNESYDAAKSNAEENIVSTVFKTGFTLTGVGAPIRIFLGDVAKMLGTEAIVPQHFEVANALGAIVGNIHAETAVEIKPNYSAGGITGYTVFGIDETLVFENLKEAEAFALSQAEGDARKEAIRRGARGQIAVSCTLKTNEAQGKDCTIHLGTRAVAHAVGSAGL
jgi:N-methylhydantoinase A/oxoprolinase/acetone carboxylase beta subunit